MNITVELLQQSPSTYFISHYMCVYKYKKEYCFSKMLVLLCNYFLDQVRHLLLNAELTCMTLSEYAASIIKSYLCGLYTPFLSCIVKQPIKKDVKMQWIRAEIS